jgi:hypothetical protein
VAHLIMSRSKTGSSCRYVTSLLATALSADDLDGASTAALGGSPKRQKVTGRGEHRNIMNLLRVLECGPDAKQVRAVCYLAVVRHTVNICMF